jgi:hypothetical protein
VRSSRELWGAVTSRERRPWWGSVVFILFDFFKAKSRKGILKPMQQVRREYRLGCKWVGSNNIFKQKH